jgi:hypothetical protein
MQKIQSFEDCVNAGYPILESYPRQCRTPDGRMFISGTDFLEVNQNTSCKQDDECKLVDKSLGFGCCYADACQAINYSEDKWISLNKEWFKQVQAQHCPSKEECGPAPMCAVRAINTNFTAECIENKCKKIPIKIEENISIPNISVNDHLNEVQGSMERNDVPLVTIPANMTIENKTENGKPTTENLTGILFGDAAYLLVLEDISTPDSCALMSVNFAANQSEITKLKICQGEETNWISPEGRVFRIKVIKTAAGYTKSENWAQVQIFG